MRRREVTMPRKEYVENTNYQNQNGKKKKNGTKKLIIWLIIFIFVFIQTFDLVLYTIGKKDKSKMWLYNSVNSVVNYITSKTKKQEVITEYEVSVAALGDIYSNKTLLKAYKTNNGYDFSTSFSNIKETLKKYDLVIGSVNAPIVDNSVISKSTLNLLPTDITKSLKDLNVSVVVAATSNINNNGISGINTTISSLKSNNIEYVGINNNKEPQPVIIEKNNIKIGIVSYLTDSSKKLTTEAKRLVSVFSEEKVRTDVKYLKSENVDYIIAYIDSIGTGTSLVSSTKKQAVETLIQNDIDIIIGSGNLVIQENFQDVVETSTEKNKHIYAVYSLGSFIGENDTAKESVSMIANFKLNKKITDVVEKKKTISTSVTYNMFIEDPILLYTYLDDEIEVYTLDEIFEKYNTDKSIFKTNTYNELVEIRDSVKNTEE